MQCDTFSSVVMERCMRAYSQDLRDRVLGALDRGERPTEIAQRYEVSRIWVYQVRSRVQTTGVRSSFRLGGYRTSRLAEWETALRSWIAAEPTLTLADLQLRLSQQGVDVKTGALWHQLNKWCLTFKKKPARRRAGARPPASSMPSLERGKAAA